MSVVLAVTVLGVPLAFAVSQIVTNDERGELERLALGAAGAVSPGYRVGDPIELPSIESGVQLAVYDQRGHRISGQGPVMLEASIRSAATGAIAQADERELLIEAVPVARGERVIAVVRAASPESAVTTRAAWWGLALLGGCIAAALCATGFAAWQSRRLVKPLERLATAAVEIGAGDFTVRTARCGVSEIDAAGASLNQTAQRLASLIDRERSFSTYASHQLRTPLTQLQLQLESGLAQGGASLRDAASAAMISADRLSQTIDDVLELARADQPITGFDVSELLEEVRETWHGVLASHGRPLRVILDHPFRVACSLPAVRQILHVLMDNALRHGRGPVTVEARDAHGAVAIDVVDQGSAAPIALVADGRLGLSLALSLASAERGRLLVDQRGRGTRFTLLLPVDSEPSAPSSGGRS